MAKMLGARCKPWCPVCKGPAGPDCPDRSASDVRTARAREKAGLRRRLERGLEQ